MEDRSTAVLWGDHFCSWIGVLTELRLRPIAVILSELGSVEIVQACVGSDCFVGLAQDITGTVLDALRHNATIGLVDGRVTARVCSLASALGIKGIVGTSSIRRKIPGWGHSTCSVTHCEEGGVTTALTHGCCLVPGSHGPDLVPVSCTVGRDASTVLSPMNPAFKFRPAPSERVLMPLRCENLGSSRDPVYHGGGLLPGCVDTRTQVLTPGVFAPRKQWALRPLTLEEVLITKDFGQLMPLLLSTGVLSHVFVQNLIPGKSLVAIAGRWGCNGGGSFLKKARLGCQIDAGDGKRRKRAKVEANVPVSGEAKSMKSNLVSETSVTSGRISLENVKQASDDIIGISLENVKQASDDIIKRLIDAKAGLQLDTDTVKEHQEKVLKAISREQRDRKAVKADDADVPEYLWEDQLLEALDMGTADELARKKVRRVSTWLRSVMLCWWQRKVTTSYIEWARDKYALGYSKEHVDWLRWEGATCAWSKSGKDDYRCWWKKHFLITHQDAVPARDALRRAAETSWWGWDSGSRPFHWRWPKFYQEVIRDGLKVHFQSAPPKYTKSQRDIPDEAMKMQVIKKLLKARKRGYIAPGVVESLTAFFAVPKGTDDIRLVYDGSVSGLNLSIWVPRFFLPTLRTHLRAVDEDTYMADVDIGEMFLNFILHRELRTLAGVDLTHYFPTDATDTEDGRAQKVWETWQRAAMGLRSSPYQAVQAMGVAEEFIRGDRLDPTNVYRWDKVVLNLPGSNDYDVTKPWVYKMRSDDGRIAADLFIFVDDLRPTGPSKREAWLAARQAASRLNFLGIQDAPRKRRGSSRCPGAWAGGVIVTTDDGVFVLTSQEKWDKAKVQIEEVRLMLAKDPEKLSRKRLEQIRGFLQYVAQTYNTLTSYMIGFHMTIDSWRPGRDHEGWRMAKTLWEQIKKEDEDWSREEVEVEEVPILVKAVPRFKDDVACLSKLLSTENPPLKRVRSKHTAKVFYGFGDASGSGFGATMQIDDGIHYQYGQWCYEVTEEKSSNWRELNNLVEFLEHSVEENGLSGCEIFIFTDNSTAEAAYWKGTSKSKALFELVLRLKLLEIERDLHIHVIHVSGKRMMRQGADGLSRAEHGIGVMLGKDIRMFIPIHLDPVVREPKVREWIDDVTRGLNFKILSSSGWFDDGHNDGNFVWTVPPAAAEVVVEQLGFMRLKRPNSMHLIVIPRLMTGRWRKHLGRGTDGYSRLEDSEVWDIKHHFEPLLIYLCLPFCSSNPKFQERIRILERFRRALYEQRLPETPSLRRRDILRQLLCDARKLCPL
jgi:hypothetical protein